MSFKVVQHPLLAHKVGRLRDESTSIKVFRELVDEIAMFLIFEATKDLPLTEKTIKTPLEETVVQEIMGKKLVLAPILRAGIGMVDGIRRMIPPARVAHIGIFRDEETLKPHLYFFKIPTELQERHFFLLDPMLATGGSANFAIDKLKERGVKKITFLCIVAAPEGVKAVTKRHPDVDIYAAALDRELNKNGYILPGLGDAGDRIFGTR